MLGQVKAAEANLARGSGDAAVFALADCRGILLAALKRAE